MVERILLPSTRAHGFGPRKGWWKGGVVVGKLPASPYSGRTRWEGHLDVVEAVTDEHHAIHKRVHCERGGASVSTAISPYVRPCGSGVVETPLVTPSRYKSSCPNVVKVYVRPLVAVVKGRCGGASVPRSDHRDVGFVQIRRWSIDTWRSGTGMDGQPDVPDVLPA